MVQTLMLSCRNSRHWGVAVNKTGRNCLLSRNIHSDEEQRDSAEQQPRAAVVILAQNSVHERVCLLFQTFSQVFVKFIEEIQMFTLLLLSACPINLSVSKRERGLSWFLGAAVGKFILSQFCRLEVQIMVLAGPCSLLQRVSSPLLLPSSDT